MTCIDNTFPTPEENLACDEALLNRMEEIGGDEVLRFWESTRYFVVLGSSNRVKDEVDVDACRRDSVPVLRRHSGGGCVLQGPGCLNFSLLLHLDPEGPTRSIPDTTAYVLRRHAAVVSELLGEQVEINGMSDLTIGGLKFSGNAQRRRLKAVLFHGTFLLNFDVDLMELYLKLPPKQPAYRAHRRHRDFVRNIGIEAAKLKRRLAQAWAAFPDDAALPLETIERLVQTKYTRPEWNFRL